MQSGEKFQHGASVRRVLAFPIDHEFHPFCGSTVRMLTRLRIRNFKRFDDVEIELGNPVLLAGPNNSGKTTALQALTLWEIGLRRWREKRSEGTPEKRPGVTINRKDLQSVPVPSANLLWRSLKTRNVQRAGGKPETQNVRIDIIVSGVDGLGKE